MKPLTLLISARAYGVETLLELVILEQLTKPEHIDSLTNKSNLTLGKLGAIIGDDFQTVASSAAHLEQIGLLKSRALFGSMKSILMDLTPKGRELMFGKKYTPTLRSKHIAQLPLRAKAPSMTFIR